MIRALLIDDDRELGHLLQEYLSPHGVELAHAVTGPDGIARIGEGGVDIVLLDVMLPGLDGFAVCRAIRDSHPELPILMLTARGDDDDRIIGLELGADDYVPKPYNARELLARIKAVLRRSRPGAVTEQFTVGDLHIDVPAHAVTIGDRAVSLTSFEFRVLCTLARRAGETVTREELAGEGYDPSVDRSLDVHISHLRQKLGDDPRDPHRIRTVRGVGYVLVRPRAAAGE